VWLKNKKFNAGKTMGANFFIEKVRAEIKKIEKFIDLNPESPLLVRLASLYLEAGDVDKAISLCSKAVQIYPDYSTAHLVMARCYIELGAYSKALAELNRVAEILPDSKFVVDLISKISLKRSKQPKATKVTSEKVQEEINLPDISEVDLMISNEIEGTSDTKVGDFEEDVFEVPSLDEKKEKVETQASYLEELIKQIEAGKSKVRNEVQQEESVEVEKELSYDDINIVTPVLAQILAGQGAYEEAIKIYKKLIEQRPQEKEKYEEEIRKLEEKMRNEDHA
jgi:tetratricopeptide (TPR) repeat protein